MLAKRTIRGNEYLYQKKEMFYNTQKTFRLNEDEYKSFVKKCHELDLVPNKVLRKLMNDFANGIGVNSEQNNNN